MVSRPAAHLVPYAAAGSVLSGLGFDALLRAGDSTARARHVTPALVATAVALGLWALVPMPALSRNLLAVDLVLIWAICLATQPRLRRALVAAIVLITAGDLVASLQNPFLHPFHDPSVFDTSRPLLTYVKEHQGLDRTFISAGFEMPGTMSKQGTLSGIYSVTDYEPLSLLRYDRFYRLLEVPSVRRPDFVTFTGTLRTDPSSPTFRLLDLMSVKYLLVPNLALSFHDELRKAGPNGGW